MEDYQSFAFTFINPVLDNVTAILETCRTREGPWTQVATLDDPKVADGYVLHGIVGVGTDVAADRRFDRFVRMRFESTGAGRVCLRMTGILKA